MGRAGIIAALMASLLATGCSLYPSAANLPESSAHAPASFANAKVPTANDSTPGATTVATSAPAANTKSADSKALTDVLAEIQELGELDRDTQAQLLKELRNTDPVLWPQMAQVFRASLAYRNQSTQRDRKTNDTGEGDSQPAPTKIKLAAATGEISPRRNSTRANSKQANDDRRAIAELEQLPIGAAFSTTPSDPPDGDYPHTDAPNALAADAANITTARPKISSKSDRANSPGVIATSFNEPVDPSQVLGRQPLGLGGPPKVKDWNGQLGLAIQSLEAEVGKSTGDEETSRQAVLRMLYLIAGRRDDSLKPIPGLPPAQQDFWSKELFGMNAMLDSQRMGDVSRRAAEANLHLREASGRLAELAPLQLRNLNFCTEVSNYGVFKKFDKNEFKAGQKVMLYAELDNFVTESTPRGFHTAFTTHYQIHDSRGNRVDEFEFPLTEEYCQNPRRDFFVRYIFDLPKQIYNGPYTLQLSMEDTIGHKIGQSSIEFSVKDK